MASSTLSELIAKASDRLTPTERRIAEAVLAESTLLAFGTVSDLASRARTSRPSIVRFAHKLGFAGYTELQDHVRRGMSQTLKRPSERIRQEEGDGVLPSRAALDHAIAAVFDAVSGERLASLGDPIATARAVWIISGETSRAGAYTLASGLSMVRPGVHLIEEHSMGRDLSHVDADDVGVVFDFYRYRRSSITAARILAEKGIPIVAITDGPLSPLVAISKAWCELSVPAIGPFDSSVPAVAVAEFLVSYVTRLLHDDAMRRIDRTEEMWARTETYLSED